MNMDFTLVLSILAIIVSLGSIFIKPKKIIEPSKDPSFEVIKRLNSHENKLNQLEKQKATIIKTGKLRQFQDDEGNVFGRHIIPRKNEK